MSERADGGFRCNCPQCQARYDLCPAARELEEIITSLTCDNDRPRALLRECLPIVVWHETSGMEGRTVAPKAQHGWVPLSDRIKAALEGR